MPGLRPLLLSLTLATATTPCLCAIARGSPQPVIEDLLWDSRPSYTRFIFALSEPAASLVYQHHPYTEDSRIFYLDLYNLRPTYRDQVIPIGEEGEGDGLLHRVQIENHPDHSAVRFIFYLGNPSLLNSVLIRPVGHSLQVDLTRREVRSAPAAAPRRRMQAGHGRGGRQLVIVDPGHGGSSLGASSIVDIDGHTVHEKDVVLQIAQRLVRRLNATGLFEARLTRSDDRFISLSDRVAMARRWEGNIFLSIHANDAGDPDRHAEARGLELFYLSETGERRLAEALFEGQGAPGRGDEHRTLQVVHAESNLTRMESRDLCLNIARAFQRDPIWKPERLGGQGHFRYIRPRNFHVLRNSSMPCVLIEVGYLTNPQECRLLVDPAFQERVTRHIVDGIIAHCVQHRSVAVGG